MYEILIRMFEFNDIRITKRLPLQPDRLRRGQVVEIGISFRIFESGERRKFVISPVSITLESDIGVSASTFKTQAQYLYLMYRLQDFSRLQKHALNAFGKDQIMLNRRCGQLDHSIVGTSQLIDQQSNNKRLNPNAQTFTSSFASSSTSQSFKKRAKVGDESPPIDSRGNITLGSGMNVSRVEDGADDMEV
jgi:hypothetical protein